MSLAAILKLLGSGEVGSLINVVQSVVHACIEEIEQLRGEHDVKASQCMEAMNRAEDRCRDLVGSAVMDLAQRVDALEAARTSGLEALQATMRTHVERLEAAIEVLRSSVGRRGGLAGYEDPGKE
jgi:hypothetical protein